MGGQVLKEAYKKAARMGIIKSLFLSFSISFGILIIMNLIFWIVGYKGLIISIAVAVVVLLITTPLIYFLKFRPNKHYLAQKIDEAGLEERVITMLELEGDDSYIAQVQREDTEKALSEFNIKNLTIVIPAALIIALSVTFVFASGTTVVGALYQSGNIDSFNEIVNPEPEKEIMFYEVSYDYEGEGFLDGELVQLVQEGTDCSPIVAEADEGWFFKYWKVNGEIVDPRVNGPLREDKTVKTDLEIIAVFEEIDDPNSDGDSDEGEEGGGSGSQMKDAPSDSGQGNAADQEQQQQQGNGDQSGGGAGGQYKPVNQVIDGTTYYGGTTYDDAYDTAIGDMKGNGNLSDEEIGIGSGYFDTIQN